MQVSLVPTRKEISGLMCPQARSPNCSCPSLSVSLFSMRREATARRFRPDIKKFGKVFKTINALLPFFALMSVITMLKMFGFSKVCLWIGLRTFST